MKKLVFILGLALIFTASCKDKIDDIQQDLVLQAMTNGQWFIKTFTQNGNDITADFNGYRFQYYSNKTVDAILNGTVQQTGSWDGSASTMSTWANFPNATHPLQLINGTWHIDRNSWIYVEASQVNGIETKTMRLEKL